MEIPEHLSGIERLEYIANNANQVQAEAAKRVIEKRLKRKELLINEIMEQLNVVVAWCNVDRLFYIRHKGEDIHHQKIKPTETDIIEALASDNWNSRFEDMRSGKKVRISDRIFYEMLGSVPPIKQKLGSFYCGEPYSGSLYYYFSTDEDGKRYGQLKTLE